MEKEKKVIYQSPETETLFVATEQIVCVSGGDTGEEESGDPRGVMMFNGSIF